MSPVRLVPIKMIPIRGRSEAPLMPNFALVRALRAADRSKRSRLEKTQRLIVASIWAIALTLFSMLALHVTLG